MNVTFSWQQELTRASLVARRQEDSRASWRTRGRVPWTSTSGRGRRRGASNYTTLYDAGTEELVFSGLEQFCTIYSSVYIVVPSLPITLNYKLKPTDSWPCLTMCLAVFSSRDLFVWITKMKLTWHFPLCGSQPVAPDIREPGIKSASQIRDTRPTEPLLSGSCTFCSCGWLAIELGSCSPQVATT